MQERTKIELRCHTKMSAGLDFTENRMSPEELVRYACENNYKAIAITDRATVQAFPEIYSTWERLWRVYQDECKEKGEQANKENFTKVIYGMEGNLLSENGEVSTVLIYAKSQIGIQNLYRLVTASYLDHFDKLPLIPREVLDKLQDGLIYMTPDELVGKEQVIEEQIGYLSPLRKGKFYPVYPEADEKLTQICEEQAICIYGEKISQECRERLDRELNAICKNGYAGLFMMWREICCKSKEEGYPFVSRGGAASSFVAYLCGITEVNPLSAECGGYNIPVETFLGIGLDKEPDININFASCIQETLQNYVKKIPGVGDICYGGTIGTYAEKTARMHVEEYYYHNELPLPNDEIMEEQVKKLCGVKRNDGYHPGGIIVAPVGEELISFTPLQHPWNSDRVTTHFDYHAPTGNLLKMDILGYQPMDIMHELQRITGITANQIPMKDENVLGVLCDHDIEEIEGLPELGSKAARDLIKETGAKNYDDLIKVCALMHGTGVWQDNQEHLVKKHTISLAECITSRDDIFLALINKGMTRENAYNIMDSVGKGKRLTEDMEQQIRLISMPEWFVDVCRKIRYLFPKAHAVSYTLSVWRLAYYMVYYPKEYEVALSAVG